MLMGKVHYRCDIDLTTIIIPTKCIETFCIGSIFPLNKASGRISIDVREKTIGVKEILRSGEGKRGSAIGDYTRDKDNIIVVLPIHACEKIFETGVDQGELRIEVVDNEVLFSQV
jgi:hypothetical protein